MSEHAHIKGLKDCITTAHAHVANLKTMTRNRIKLAGLNVIQDMLRHIAKAIDELDTPRESRFGLPRVKRANSRET